MFSFSRIVKTSYLVTVQNPLLWLFGLLLVGGFNLNFLYFLDLPLRNLRGMATAEEVARYLLERPGTLVVLGGLAVFTAAGLLLLNNWSRIMLALASKEILDRKAPAYAEQLKKSKKLLWPVVKVSLLTLALILVTAAGLLGAPYWLVNNPSTQALLWTIGVVFLVPLSFTISSINTYTSFYIVLFKQPFGKALNLGTDFFLTNWPQVLGLSAVLMVIYSAGFAGGAALVYLVRSVLEALTNLLGQVGVQDLSATFILIKVLAGLVLWIMIAGLNVFFNTALLVLFLQLNTPVEREKEKGKEIMPLPASSSV